MPQTRYRKTVVEPKAKAAQDCNRAAHTIVIVCVLTLATTTSGCSIFRRSKGGTEITTASGLKYIDVVVGTGATPQKGQTVTVHYTGTLENGKKFDSSYDHPGAQPSDFPIGVGSLIKGWDEGIITMKVGGKRRLIIPPNLGYGQIGRPPVIPGDSTLIFDIELLAVSNGVKPSQPKISEFYE